MLESLKFVTSDFVNFLYTCGLMVAAGFSINIALSPFKRFNHKQNDNEQDN